MRCRSNAPQLVACCPVTPLPLAHNPVPAQEEKELRATLRAKAVSHIFGDGIFTWRHKHGKAIDLLTLKTDGYDVHVTFRVREGLGPCNAGCSGPWGRGGLEGNGW